MSSSRNPFGIGRSATEKANYTQLENHLAYQFRKGIMSKDIPILDPTDASQNKQTQQIIPLPDEALTTEYFKNKTITGETLAKNIVFRNTPLFSSDLSSNYSPSTIKYVYSSINARNREVISEDQLAEILNQFSDDVDAIKEALIPIDPSLHIIVQPGWATEPRIADQSITTNKLAFFPLPHNISLENTNSTVGTHPATTNYVITQSNLFIGDASFSVGDLAAAIQGATDASFNVSVATKQSKSAFDISFSHIENTIRRDNSFNTISQSQTITIPNFDSSLNLLYSRNNSLISILSEISLNSIPSFATIDTSFNRFKQATDTSLAEIFTNGWISSSRFNSSLTLPSPTTLAAIPTDTSSNQVATTNFVKNQIQERIATTELLASYGALANAINQDVSFSYNVVQHAEQFDSSISSFSTKITTIESTITTEFPLKTTSVNTLERNANTQDISVNSMQTQIAGLSQIDMSLVFLENAATYMETRQWIPYFDGSTSAITLSLANSIAQEAAISAKYDASYSLLDGNIQERKITELDLSLNTELNNRENNTETRFEASYNILNTKLNQLDVSFVAVSATTTGSINDLFDRADASLVILTQQLSDLSSHIIDFEENTDSSLVFLRETLGITNNSLTNLLSHTDLSLNMIYQQIDDISSNIFTGINEKLDNEYATLKTRIDSDAPISDSSLAWFSQAFVVRDTRWNNSMDIIDTSFQVYRNTWNQLNTYTTEKMGQIRLLDSSFTALYRRKKTEIRSLDSSLSHFSQNYETYKEKLDISLNTAYQNIYIWKNYQFLNSVSDLETAIENHDSSLVLISANGWVENITQPIVLGNTTTILTENDASGNQIANTAFFKEKLRETVGMAASPLDGLNELSAAVNSQEDYAIYIGGYLNDIGIAVESFRTAIADLSTNTTMELNYDTSLNTLNADYSALEGKAAAVDLSFVSAKQLLDTSLSSIAAVVNWIDGSWNSLQRTNEIGELTSSMDAIDEIYRLNSANFDASVVSLMGTFVSLETAAAVLANDASYIVYSLTDLSGTYQTNISALDASYGVVSSQWIGQATNVRFPHLDASFSDTYAAISTVNNGINTYLTNAVAGSSYQTSFSLINGRLNKTDASLVAVETHMNSFVVDICNNIAVSSVLSALNSEYSSIVLDHNTNTGNITTIDSSGWVISRLLDPSLVLPSGITISTGNTGIATVADVKTSIQNVIANATPALDTLVEFATALNEDASLVLTLDGRLAATDGCLNQIEQTIELYLQDAATTIAKDGSMNYVAGQYSSLGSTAVSLLEKIVANDASTNLAGTALSGVNGKTASMTQRLATNDASTNLLDSRIRIVETSSNIIELSLETRQAVSGVIDTSFTNLRNISTQILGGITTNDISTNALPTQASVRETSANTIVALLGTPGNFRVAGNTTTSLTCAYAEPVLRDAVGVNNYRLTARPTYGSVTTVVRDVSSGINQVELTGLSSGAVYDLSLAATNPYGTVVIAGVSGTTALFSPTGLAGSASTTSSFTVGWSSGGGNLTKYGFNLKNEAIDVSGGEVVSSTTTRNFTGLLDGTPYLFLVRSANPYIASVDASLIYGTIFAAPSVPTFVSRTTADLSFSVVGTTNPYVRYNISYRAVTAGTNFTSTDTSSNMSLSGLTTGRIYDISVNIQNAYGTSAWSPRLRNSTSLVVPASLSSTGITDVSLQINFTALAIQDCSYVLRTNPNTTQYVLAAGATSRVLTGLTEATTYEVILDASNVYTTSQIKNSALGTIFSKPSTPTFVSRTTADLSFSVVGTTKPYVRYNISYRPLGGSVLTATDVSSNFRLADLSNGRIYDVSVNIQNAYGSSVWSSSTRNSTGIVLPTLSVGTITSETIDVSFSSALATQDCSYVLRTDPATTRYALAAGATSQSLIGLVPSTAYSIILDASNIYTSSSVNTSATTSVGIPNNYRYYRFETTLLRGVLNNTTPNSVQFSELDFRNNGVRVDYSTAVATNPGGNSPGNEGPSKAIDNSVNTKYLSFITSGFIDYSKGHLVVDFGTNTQITEYTYATANDAPDRDPISWVLSGSSNGTSWTAIQTINAYPTTTDRNTYLPYFNVSPIPPVRATSLAYYYDFETYSDNNLRNNYNEIIVFDASLGNATITTTGVRMGTYGIESTMTNGTDYMVKMPNIDFSLTGSFTILVSVYITNFPGGGNDPWIVSFRNASLIYGIRVSSTSITVYTNGGNTSVAATGLTLAVNKWYTISVSQNSTTTKIYKDGVLLATQSMAIANSNGLVSSMAVLGSGGDSSIFQGYMDDYRFYSAVLTDTEILNIHEQYPVVYDINSMVVTEEFTGQNTGSIGLALDASLTRAVSVIFGGDIFLSKYVSGSWTSFNSFDVARYYYSGVALTDDGNLGVASVGWYSADYIYKFTWNSGTSTYNTLTQTLDTNSRVYMGVAITPTGNRIVACTTNGRIYYADWDSGSSNFGVFTETLDTATRRYSCIAISRDGSRIVYGTEDNYCYFANWNGSNYSSGTQIGSAAFYSAGIVMTNDMNQIWMSTAYDSTASLWYSFWDGTTYGEFTAVPDSKIAGGKDGWGLWINPSSTLLYFAPYGSSTYYRITLPIG